MVATTKKGKRIKVTLNFRERALKEHMKTANFQSLWQAGGFIKAVAKNSIKTRKKDKMKRRTATSKQAVAFKKLLAKSDPRVIQALLASAKAARDRRETSKPGAVPLTSSQRQLSRAMANCSATVISSSRSSREYGSSDIFSSRQIKPGT